MNVNKVRVVATLLVKMYQVHTNASNAKLETNHLVPNVLILMNALRINTNAIPIQPVRIRKELTNVPADRAMKVFM